MSQYGENESLVRRLCVVLFVDWEMVTNDEKRGLLLTHFKRRICIRVRSEGKERKSQERRVRESKKGNWIVTTFSLTARSLCIV